MAEKDIFPVNMVGDELRNLLRLIEEEERDANLGETSGPLLDLYETKDSVVVEADLPGIDPSGVSLVMCHGFLTIEGTKRDRQAGGERMNYLCLERSFEPFRRIVRIAVPINPKKAKAVYSRGVLKITFPKVEDRRGEPITIRIERARTAAEK